MKTNLLLSTLFTLILSFGVYLTACKKDSPLSPENELLKPISVSFSRNAIIGLLNQVGTNELAGLCFMPVQEGDHINLQAIPAEWNTSEGKPSEMIKVMDKAVMGTLTNDPCPELYANGTSEFELVFFNKATIQRFLEEAHFYPNTVQKADGLYFSRMLLDLNTGYEYKKYRGLLMKPYPQPDFSKEYSEREGTGYEIGVVCPPPWYQ